MGEPMIKGGAIAEFLAWYQRKRGDEGVREVARRAPPDLAHLFDPDDPMHILPSSWYPVRLVHAALDTITDGMTPTEIEVLAKEAARDRVQHGMSSVYRFLFQTLGTPEVYAKMIPRMWRQLHDSGDRAVKILGDGKAISTVANWRGHHPVLCLLTVELMCAIFQEMGCKNVRWKRITCGGSECRYEVTWALRA